MPRVLKSRRSIAPHLRTFARSKEGNVSMIFGLCLVPLIGMVGLGIDYGMASSAKAKLDNAADTAAIAAVATAKAYVAANPTDPNVTANAIIAGISQATNTFNVNTGKLPLGQFTLQTPVLTRTGQTFASSVSYNAQLKNNFGQIFGQTYINLKNTAAATADVPSYLDFYLLVDVSGSMGLPTTAAGMALLASKNNDLYSDYQQGCQFACHFPGNVGWTVAVNNNIQLRSDAVNSAVCSLITRASSPSVPNQYRIGVYPFINQMAQMVGITSNMATLQSTVCPASTPTPFTQMLDTGTTQLSTNNDPTTGTGSGGTHFEVVFPQMQSTISPYGDGSLATKSRPFVFLVTDGMENGQHYFTMAPNGKYAYPGNPSSFSGYASAWWDGSSPSQIDPSQCAALKTAGATIAILYIPYNQIVFTNNGGYTAWENTRVNGFSPTLATPLQQCASSGFFYTANTPTDITNALNAMFNQALQVAHLTQ